MIKKSRKISPMKIVVYFICPFFLEVKLIKEWAHAVKRWDEKRGTD